MSGKYNSLDKQARAKDYLSPENTSSIKGIFAIIILFGHLKNGTQVLSTSPIGKLMGLLAYLVVGGFFFFSGYGLSINYKSKGREYIKRFPGRRLLPFYATCMCFTFLNIIMKLLIGQSLKIEFVLKSIFMPGVGVGFGWYIQALFFFYILFWIVFYFFPHLNRVVGYCLIFFIYFSINFFFLPMLWWQSSLGFVLGCFWAEYKDIIDKAIGVKKRYIIILVLSFITMAVTVLLGNINRLEIYWYSNFFKFFSIGPFIATILLIVKTININNLITRFLGRISFEIYCVQVLFLELFHSRLIYIHNDILYIGLTIICVISFSAIINPLINWIKKKSTINYKQHN